MESDKSKAFFPYSKSSNYFMDSTDTHIMNKWPHSQITHSDFWALTHTCSILSIRRRKCPKGDYQLSQWPPILVSLEWDLSIMEYATGALLFRKELPIELQFLDRHRSRLFFDSMIYEVDIFAQYTYSLFMLLHYCFPSIRGRANFSHLCQLYMWIEMANMLSDLFHRAFKVMCSDHFKCMCLWMYMGNSIQWCMNLKEWPDDLEISSKGVKTEVAVFCLLIASVVVSLPNSTSIHVITCVLCFRCCNAYYVV